MANNIPEDGYYSHVRNRIAALRGDIAGSFPPRDSSGQVPSPELVHARSQIISLLEQAYAWAQLGVGIHGREDHDVEG